MEPMQTCTERPSLRTEPVTYNAALNKLGFFFVKKETTVSMKHAQKEVDKTEC